MKPVDEQSIDETVHGRESFLSRFHRRKTEARSDPVAEEAPTAEPIEDQVSAQEEPIVDDAIQEQPTDADMPPIESLNEKSDYSPFMSPKVSEVLRNKALRKLFHSSSLNVIDELDEYIEDFTTFEPLGDIVTSDMRHRIEQEARRKADELKAALLDDEVEVIDEEALEEEAETESEIQATHSQPVTQDEIPNEEPVETEAHDSDRTESRTQA